MYNSPSVYGQPFVSKSEIINYEMLQFRKTGDYIITSDYFNSLDSSFVLRFFINKIIGSIICFGAAVVGTTSITPSYNSSDPYGGDTDFPTLAKADLSSIIGDFNSLTQYSASLDVTKENTFGFACTFKNGVFMLRCPKNIYLEAGSYNALTPTSFFYG